MKNNQKSNPFINPEFQNSLIKFSSMYSEILKKSLPSDLLPTQMNLLKEDILKPYRQILQSYSTNASSALVSSLSQMSEAMAILTRDNVTNAIYNNLNESLKKIISLHDLQQQFSTITPKITPDASEKDKNLPKDDFVIVNEAAIEPYEFPDSICIPVGNHKIKISTSIFLSIIGMILSIFISVTQSVSSRSEGLRQQQIEETQIQLQRSQNELLMQLLQDIDVSSSSEIESINELTKSVEEQNKLLSQIRDISSLNGEYSDNSEEVEDTDDPK